VFSLRSLLPLGILALLSTLATAPAAAAWSTDPFVNDLLVPGVSDSGIQDLVAVPDGSGGMLLAWLQERPGTTIRDAYAHRIDAEGQPVWPEPLEVRTAQVNISDLTALSDGNGGMYLAILDFNGNGSTVFVQFIDGSFDVQWTEGGIDVAPGALSINADNPVLADMGADGLFVAWEESRASANGTDIWAQRIAPPFFQRAWGDTGIEICGADGNQDDLAAVGVEGGAFVAWNDQRDVGSNQNDVYMQYVDATWTVWSNDGEPVAATSVNQQNPSLAPDGAGGVWVAWQSTITTPASVRVARWTAGAQELFRRNVTGTPAASQLDARIAAHPAYGAVVIWNEIGGFVGPLVSQRIAPSGLVLWGSEGVPVRPSDEGQSPQGFHVTADGAPVILFEELGVLYAQRLDPDGSRMFGDEALTVSMASPDFYDGEAYVPSGDGFLAAWSDARDLDGDDVYGARIDAWGFLGDPTPQVTAVADYPQDQGGVVRVDWTRSHLDDPAHGDVTRYTVWRRLATAAKSALSPEELDARIVADAARSGLPAAVVLDQLKAGWAYVDEQPAFFQAEYAYHAPTYGDSTDTETIVTEFKVIAHATGSTPYWESDVATGYSVDNLAPAAPQLLTASLDLASALLDWRAVASAPDLREYRIYRSDAPGFTPDASTFVAAVADTSYVDALPAGGAWHYRVSAVDVHGNEGVPSNEAVVELATGVEDLPGRTRLVGVAPNPFNPATTVRFELSRASRATVRILDPRGRVVRTLASGDMPAGLHALTWDGRDSQGRPRTSGVYFVRMETETERFTRKIMLVK